MGEPGVYAVVVGNEFRAISNDLARNQAPALATRAFQTHNQDGVAAVLHDFVERVGDVRSGGSGESEGGGGFPTWLLAVGGAIAALLGVRAYRRRQRRERELGEVKAVAREDLVALADDVVGLDEQVDAHPDAKEAYLRGMEAYQRADDAFDRARSPEDLARVSAAIADSRYDMETAKALMSGAPAPERRPPCFFDARHGSSVQDVTWISPHGGAMTVPACEEDARRVLAGEEPDTRQVSVGGVRRPLWDAPGYFQPWAFGFFGAAAGGALLASAFAPDAVRPPASTISVGATSEVTGAAVETSAEVATSEEVETSAAEGTAAAAGSKDYSSTPLSRKLGAKPDADVVVFFTTSREELERRFPALKATMRPADGLWIAWPKKASKIETDLDFDTVQRIGLDAGLVDNKSAAIDDLWQAVRFVYRLEDR